MHEGIQRLDASRNSHVSACISPNTAVDAFLQDRKSLPRHMDAGCAFIRSFSMKVCGIVLSPNSFLIFYVSNFINYTCINLIILSHFVIRKYI